MCYMQSASTERDTSTSLVLQTPNLRETPAVPVAEKEEFGEVAAPTFSAIQGDHCIREIINEDPDEDVSDRMIKRAAYGACGSFISGDLVA